MRHVWAGTTLWQGRASGQRRSHWPRYCLPGVCRVGEPYRAVMGSRDFSSSGVFQRGRLGWGWAKCKGLANPLWRSPASSRGRYGSYQSIKLIRNSQSTTWEVQRELECPQVRFEGKQIPRWKNSDFRKKRGKEEILKKYLKKQWTFRKLSVS